MNGKILFFDEWKNFNASLNEEIESRKLTEKQKEEFYKNGEFNKKYDDFLEEFLGTITGTIANYMSTYHIEKKQENDKNYSHMEQIWGEGFDLYSFYLDSISEFRNSLLNYLDQYYTIDNSTKGIVVFKVLTCLQGRAIQTGNEILVLLRNGYADGAYARFRTMYEICVLAHFISDQGDECAKAYIEYNGDWYDWAGKFMSKSKKHYTFNDIEKECKVNLQPWKAEYKLSNKLVHASSQGTFSRLSLEGEFDDIPIGPVDSGIVTPATNSLTTLFEINKVYFSTIPDPIVNLWILALQKIKNECCNKFKELEKLHFPDKK